MPSVICDLRDGHPELIDLLGAKAVGLGEMIRLGIPTPPGFVITTKGYEEFKADRTHFFDAHWGSIRKAVASIQYCNRRFDDLVRPLLLSIRSSGKYSMPGIMVTLLNVGLTENHIDGLARVTNDVFCAHDAYVRLLRQLGTCSLRIFPDAFRSPGTELPCADDSTLIERLKAVTEDYRNVVSSYTGSTFPIDAWMQLRLSIESVFDSWSSDGCRRYRHILDIPEQPGPAVVIQAMIHGNKREHSGSGVVYTRNPLTGRDEMYGEFLFGSQGCDLASGLWTPEPLECLSDALPDTYRNLVEVATLIRSHFGRHQEIEFTVEDGKLFILQTRPMS